MSEPILEVSLYGHDFIIDARKALFLPKEETLFIADVHLGKPAHFRQQGVYVPKEVQLRDLRLIKGLLQFYAAKRLVVLGDLVHAQKNMDWVEAKDFFQAMGPIEKWLVKGNHDKISAIEMEQLGFQQVVTNFSLGGIILCHKPDEFVNKPEELVGFCGHIHPSYYITGKGKSGVRLPCFHLSKEGILTFPAFGGFTGTYAISPTVEESIWLCTPTAVLPLKF